MSQTQAQLVGNVVTGAVFAGIVTATSANIGGAVGINSTGISVAGVITATTFSGAVTGTATSTTNIPNLSGDVSSSNTVTTLPTVNSNVGTFGSGGAIPTITVNAKGLITGVTTTAVTSGTTITDDTSTNASRFLTFTSATSGSISAANVSSTKLTFNPSTGTLSATTLSGTVSGSNVSGNITGNAANITAYTINQSVGTSNNVQFNSIGAGTAASGTTGEIRATNNVTAYYSDDRLKTRLGNIENALDKVCSLTGFYYEANETAQALGYQVKREVGVSAQDVEKVLPEIVTSAPISDEYKTIYYDKLVPLLIEAIKEQQEQINELKSQLGGN